GCSIPTSYFVNKAYKAQLAGAVGVIFIFNQPGNQVATMGLPAGPNPTITIPLMLVSNSYGNTLKAEILSGPVNVSLSAPTVIANDECSFTSITHQQTFTAGNCPSSYTLVNTWTATDQCGNATTKSQTITVADNTPPTLTVPADVTLQCSDPLPLMPLNINSSSTFIDGTYNIGTAIFGAPLTATPLTADAVMVIDDAGNPYDACDSIINDLTGKIAVIERSGCTPPTGYFVNKAYKAQQAGAIGVIFINNIAGDYVFTMGLPAGPNPTITIPLMLVSNSYGNTLKAEILSGPVNVSLSAPTVIANDECSFTAITHQQTFTPGNCPSSYTLVNTWTATDNCNNATTKTQTITVVDNTPPTLTVPADVTLQCSDPLPAKPINVNSSPNGLNGTYSFGTAVFGAPLTSTAVTGNVALVNDGVGNPADACEPIIGSLAGKIAVMDRGGCTAPAALFTNKVLKAQTAGAIAVIVVNNNPGNEIVTMGGSDPSVTIPSVFVSNNYGNALKASMALGTVNISLSASTVIADDECSGVLITFTEQVIPGSCPNNYSKVITWTATDGCGNATTKSQTITVVDNTPPTFTAPPNITIPFTSTCGYDSSPANAGDVTNEHDNCSTGLQATYTDAVMPCGSNIVITRTWHLVDACGNAAAEQVQTITVTDNNTPYIIYAVKEVFFGKNNYINGDVGVTDSKGKAEFDKGCVLDPYHVYAKNINVSLPATVNNKHYAPATGGPNPPFYPYAGGGLSGNYTQSTNGVVPAGNFNKLTIKKGVTATVNGSNYGTISIEQNASVTFTSSSVDIVELSVDKGKNGTTNVYFSTCTRVRVKNKVTVDESCRINVGGPKLTFYLGDNNKDEERFKVTGENTEVTANIMIPNGKLKVDGGNAYCIMTGWFIVEKLESSGKNVTWNKNVDCTPTLARGNQQTITINEEPVVELPKVEKAEAFEVRVYPNPSAHDFSLQIFSRSNEPVTVRIIDAKGSLKQVQTGLSKANLLKVGADLIGGSYFAEVIQGTNRKVVKLIKLN
ncbi:MAG: PA domain-containing protein, partial [Ferruginibacter sp.]